MGRASVQARVGTADTVIRCKEVSKTREVIRSLDQSFGNGRKGTPGVGVVVRGLSPIRSVGDLCISALLVRFNPPQAPVLAPDQLRR